MYSYFHCYIVIVIILLLLLLAPRGTTFLYSLQIYPYTARTTRVLIIIHIVGTYP